MNASHWATVAIASAVGSLTQGATGFGSAMIAIPLMLWGGLTLPAAIAVNTAIITLQGATSCWKHRESIPWSDTKAMVVLRFVSVPVGVLALTSMQAWGPIFVKQIVGITLLATLAFLLAFKVRPVAHLSPIWTAIAGSTSGFLTGAVGMGGAPLVTWTLTRDWEPARVRGFLWATSLQMVPISLVLLVWQFGAQVLWSFLVGMIAFPIVALGNRWGIQLGDTFSRTVLRRVTYTLLAFTASVSILAPWLTPTQRASLRESAAETALHSAPRN
jgi:uncharacterized protein